MIYKKNILLFFIIFWIVIAVTSVLYNSFKTISEVQEWVPLSDNQKRQIIFGAPHDFSVFINSNTESNAKILFYSETNMPYFYARYNSYPRYLYWQQNIDEYAKRTQPKQFDYIAVYNMQTSLKGYELHASYSAKQSGIFGSLYKRK